MASVRTCQMFYMQTGVPAVLLAAAAVQVASDISNVHSFRLQPFHKPHRCYHACSAKQVELGVLSTAYSGRLCIGSSATFDADQ
jgi:hypothetical protein